MRLISRKALRSHFEKPGRDDSAQPLLTWAKVVDSAAWTSIAEVKQQFPTADYVSGDRFVFNIGGNKYRIVAAIKFGKGIVWVIWVGTHKEYDQIDVRTVKHESNT